MYRRTSRENIYQWIKCNPELFGVVAGSGVARPCVALGHFQSTVSRQPSFCAPSVRFPGLCPPRLTWAQMKLKAGAVCTMTAQSLPRIPSPLISELHLEATCASGYQFYRDRKWRWGNFNNIPKIVQLANGKVMAWAPQFWVWTVTGTLSQQVFKQFPGPTRQHHWGMCQRCRLSAPPHFCVSISGGGAQQSTFLQALGWFWCAHPHVNIHMHTRAHACTHIYVDI